MGPFLKYIGTQVLTDCVSVLFMLKENPVDAMAVSFYKIFGRVNIASSLQKGTYHSFRYPTGIGALIVKEKFLSQLQRPWFSGGAVELVQVPGINFTRSRHLYEQFEVRFSALEKTLHSD